MNPVRSVLLAASESRWLRERAVRHPLVRHGVARFLPGEELGDAIAAGASLQARGIGLVLTRLGESVTSRAEADAVAAHYHDVLEQLRPTHGRSEISVKPTQLGLDVDPAVCRDHLHALVRHAREAGTFVWIDMEQSRYVDATLRLCLDARRDAGPVGVCVQAYLHRTPPDLETLLAGGAAVRLVKGAYREPPDVALASKADVDAAFLTLARRMLSARGDARRVFGTHDTRLIAAIDAAAGADRAGYEYHLLYGIQRTEQERLAAEGRTVRVLVSYGSYWFPWYMRRLAERPANLWFVARSVFSR